MIQINERTSNKRNKLLFNALAIFFSFFFCSLFQLNCGSQEASESMIKSVPIIAVQEEQWDFGEISVKEIPSHNFLVKNDGNGLLIIKRIWVACESCVDVNISKKEILPQESAELKVSINSLNMRGHFTKRIYIKSNDPDHPQISVTVSGFIKKEEQSFTDKKPQNYSDTTVNQNMDPFTKGMSHFIKAEYDEAIPEFEKAIELKPNDTEGYYYLGQSYLQQGINEYNNKNIFKAYNLYRKANKVAEQVIPLYEQMIKEDPKDLNILLKLGYIYEVKSLVPFINEYDEALKYYLRALDLETVNKHKNTGYFINLNARIGIIYFQMEDYSEALSYLEQSMQTNQSGIGVEVYYYLGLAYDKIDEKEKALEYLLKVEELSPQSDFAREAQKKIEELVKD